MKNKKIKKFIAHDLTQISEWIVENDSESNLIFLQENLSYDEIVELLKILEKELKETIMYRNFLKSLL